MTTSGDGAAVSEFETSALVDCTDGIRFEITLSFGGRLVPIQSNGSFSFNYSGPLTGGGDISEVTTAYTIAGTFGTDGSASGTVAVTTLAFKYQGNPYTCSQNPVPWNAKRQL